MVKQADGWESVHALIQCLRDGRLPKNWEITEEDRP